MHSPSPTLRRKAALILTTGVLLAGATTVTASSPAERLLALDRTLVIAHRGYSGIAPENTQPAVVLAKQAGADLVELDYYTSSDGVAMVFHDRTLDRTSNAIAAWGKEGLRVADMTARALMTLDVGAWFHPRYAGTRMLTLVEALEIIQADGGVTLVERKEGTPEDIVRILLGRDLVNQVVVQAFDWAYLKGVHELLPGQVLGALGPPSVQAGTPASPAERALSPAWIDQAAAAGARVVGWNTEISPEAVAYAHSKGMLVWVYTINDQATAARMLDMGVDGLISDFPAIVWRALALRAQR
jgi:glycerophosphoryl diester phosphodiesterase